MLELSFSSGNYNSNMKSQMMMKFLELKIEFHFSESKMKVSRIAKLFKFYALKGYPSDRVLKLTLN